MKSILLSGYNIHIGVDDGKLVIKDGRDWEKEPTEMVYKPKFVDFDQIILYGHTGNLTISGMKWLMKHRVTIHLLDYNGSLLSTMNPPRSKTGFTRIAQYKAFEDGRIDIAKKIIEAKLLHSNNIIRWLSERYSEVGEYCNESDYKKSMNDLTAATRNREVLGVEGNYAKKYWKAISQIFPNKFHFETRTFGRTNRPIGAVDPINALFNYGYSILEGWCRRAINTANLDPYIGFLHEMKNTREPLVYDLQEPYRWLVDLTILKALERNTFHKKDFIRTDDYIIRIRSEGVKKLMIELDNTFSQTVKYRGMNQQWGNIILLKTQELANQLLGKRKTIDFASPHEELERVDNQNLRNKILNLSYVEWKDMGFSKGTLHNLKLNAKGSKPFTINSHIRIRLESI
jgi:CRISP-associated protein Cas1